MRAEGADMPTGKTKSRCAWEAVNAPAIQTSGNSSHKSHVVQALEPGGGRRIWTCV